MCRRDVPPLGNDRHEVALAAQPLSTAVMLDASCRRELGSAGAAIWRSKPRHGPFAGAVCNNLEIGGGGGSKKRVGRSMSVARGRPPRGIVLMDNSEVYEVGGVVAVAVPQAKGSPRHHRSPTTRTQRRRGAMALLAADSLQCPWLRQRAALCSCGLHLCPRKHTRQQSLGPQPSANGFGNSPRSVGMAVRPAVGGYPWMDG